mmetsp:Transcript_822/g.2351  ORF Transcript_822/g.2351 Transcript_822/m.2351 type:complete len:240 (-) Transcript_822:214-933(-)
MLPSCKLCKSSSVKPTSFLNSAHCLLKFCKINDRSGPSEDLPLAQLLDCVDAQFGQQIVALGREPCQGRHMQVLDVLEGLRFVLAIEAVSDVHLPVARVRLLLLSQSHDGARVAIEPPCAHVPHSLQAKHGHHFVGELRNSLNCVGRRFTELLQCFAFVFLYNSKVYVHVVRFLGHPKDRCHVARGHAHVRHWLQPGSEEFLRETLAGVAVVGLAECFVALANVSLGLISVAVRLDVVR